MLRSGMLARAALRPTMARRAMPQAGRSLATSSDMITLEIDGKSISVPKGSSLIQACELAGVSIPRFCYHTGLAIAGNCRMCLVEVKPGPPKPQASCAMPALPGQKVFTNTDMVKKAREGIMEFLLANHPLDCPICDQGGQCDLQDQSMRYGSDRSRFHEITGKRAVEDKDMGPFVKTVMTRCIHCTRCVRFANDVAGVTDLGTTGRGNDMQIGSYVQKTVDSEMSANIIDLCPVGALTSKPYAFQARPWELKHTESVDVLDAVGSNIVVQSRGVQVMRIQPRPNDEINEEWINDKTRFALDGLKTQRLTTPLIRQGERFVPASWSEALDIVGEGLAKSGATGNQIQGIAGALADSESMVALKDLLNRLGSDNLTTDQTGGSSAPAHGIDFRSNYLFNSTIPQVEQADQVLLVGTNPRHEAAIINTRLRKSWVRGDLDVGLIGESFDSTVELEHIGTDLKAVKDFVAGKGDFAKKFAQAKKPLIIIGSAISEHAEGGAVYETLAKYVHANKNRFITPEWNGFSTLQRAASRAAAYDIGFVPSKEAAKATPKFIYLLNADDFDPSSIPKNAFVVYQGHHGDLGAQYADVCLPGAAYTEKGVTWVNTEGRTQLGRAAVSPPGASREDWKIVRAVSEAVGETLPYDELVELRNRMWDVCPSLVRYGTAEKTSAIDVGLQALVANAGKATLPKGKTGAFQKPIADFYRTDAISRSSVSMAQGSQAFTHKAWHTHEAELPLASHA
ncbi:hypothetical protein E5Q_06052 [Mixia osmundae IAM 14324]|uniref:NADH-ubiquinone oxidoreductase 78 kDa subunit, mitochondrial n=1 Tax=Mixia osmundae (strain CBS 9802 / IAM 14324 / JCM 22182 / KY 12970) TaxID=764103 RepID=G7E9N8_MIXOS|nr:hypothetical protein E5Q_06052 [Mixia osmundae IAM 14324]